MLIWGEWWRGGCSIMEDLFVKLGFRFYLFIYITVVLSFNSSIKVSCLHLSLNIFLPVHPVENGIVLPQMWYANQPVQSGHRSQINCLNTGSGAWTGLRNRRCSVNHLTPVKSIKSPKCKGGCGGWRGEVWSSKLSFWHVSSRENVKLRVPLCFATVSQIGLECF